MSSKFKTVLSVLCFTTLSAYAQDFSIGVEQRNRGEVGRGYKGKFGDQGGAGGVLFNRTRLKADFTHSFIDVKVTLQNSGMWGESDRSSSNNSVVVYESYANIKLGKGFAFKGGRQELKYDEGRILSSPKWGNAGSSHDAAILSFKHHHLNIHAGGAFNNDDKNQEFYKTDVYHLASNKWYRSMFYGWLHYDVKPHFGFSVLYLNEGLLGEDKKTRHRSTYGGQVDFKKKRFSTRLSAYGQFGKDYADNKEGGFLLAGSAAYKISKHVNLKAGYDHYSKAQNGHKGFTWLYGSAHNFGGYMDFWLEDLNSIRGLGDAYLGVSGKGKTLSYTVDVHAFHSASETVSGTGKHLGDELDITVTYPFKKWCSLEAGASVYMMTDASRAAKHTQVDAGAFGYLTLSVIPSSLRLSLKGKSSH